MDKPNLNARCERLFGRNWQSAYARAVGLSDRTIRRRISDTPEKCGEFVALVELLERLPRDLWPARWAALARRS